MKVVISGERMSFNKVRKVKRGEEKGRFNNAVLTT